MNYEFKLLIFDFLLLTFPINVHLQKQLINHGKN